jgi:hypothetical protein
MEEIEVRGSMPSSSSSFNFSAFQTFGSIGVSNGGGIGSGGGLAAGGFGEGATAPSETALAEADESTDVDACLFNYVTCDVTVSGSDYRSTVTVAASFSNHGIGIGQALRDFGSIGQALAVGEEQAVIDGINRTIAIIDRAETISDVLTVGGVLVDVLTGPSGEAVIIGAVAKASANKAIKEAFENQLKQHGLKSLQRSHRKITQRLNEHLRRLDEIRAAGGRTSSVEREIRTFQRQIEVLDDIFKGL